MLNAFTSGLAAALWEITISNCVQTSLWTFPGCCVAPARLIPKEAHNKIRSAAEKIKKGFHHYKFLGWQKAGDIGPRKYRIRVDFKVF